MRIVAAPTHNSEIMNKPPQAPIHQRGRRGLPPPSLPRKLYRKLTCIVAGGARSGTQASSCLVAVAAAPPASPPPYALAVSALATAQASAQAHARATAVTPLIMGSYVSTPDPASVLASLAKTVILPKIGPICTRDTIAFSLVAVASIHQTPRHLFLGDAWDEDEDDDEALTWEDDEDPAYVEYVTNLVIWEQSVRNIFYICTYDGLLPEIPHTAVRLFQAFLGIEPCSVPDLECLQVACITLAHKLEEDATYHDIVAHMSQRMLSRRSVLDINRMEIRVLKALDWQVTGSYSAVGELYKAMDLALPADREGLDSIREEAIAALDVASMDGRIMWTYSSEVLIRAVLCLIGMDGMLPPAGGFRDLPPGLRECIRDVRPAFEFAAGKTSQDVHSVYARALRRFGHIQIQRAATSWSAASPEPPEEAIASEDAPIIRALCGMAVS